MNKELGFDEIALALKELGFDEPCLIKDIEQGEDFAVYYVHQNGRPTFSQAFRWFREKHGLYHTICPEFYRNGINFNWQILWYLPKEKWSERTISGGTMWYGDNGEYPSQEEAELACLIKLIEIVKNK